MRVEASAPGKLVLLGEYVVLHGAPAIVMAVNRRARVQIVPSSQRWSVVTAFDVVPHPVEFAFDDDGTVVWRNPAPNETDRLKLFAHILRAIGERKLIPYSTVAPFAASLNTTPFFQRSDGEAHKLGLGSSAALTVALSAALAAYGGGGEHGLLGQASWLRELLSIHHSFQQGRGSGLDVAASWKGGIITYRLGSSATIPEVKCLKLPAGIEFLCVWSGKPASTTSSLGRYAQWQQEHPQDASRHITHLASIAENGVRAIETNDAGLLLKAVEEYGRSLWALGEQCGLEIYTETHQHIAQLASSLGLVYKPCGAGGGDTGIALGKDPDKLKALESRLTGVGILPLPLLVDPAGLMLDANDPFQPD